jgi:hypothetical protein
MGGFRFAAAGWGSDAFEHRFHIAPAFMGLVWVGVRSNPARRIKAAKSSREVFVISIPLR